MAVDLITALAQLLEAFGNMPADTADWENEESERLQHALLVCFAPCPRHVICPDPALHSRRQKDIFEILLHRARELEGKGPPPTEQDLKVLALLADLAPTERE